MSNLSNKLELALVAYLSRYGGTVAPALLADEAARFDNLAFFNPNPVTNRLLLPKWQDVDADPFGATEFAEQGLIWYPGHWDGDMDDTFPRCVVSCSRVAGDGQYAGFPDCDVTVKLLSKDPIGLGVMLKALEDILADGQLVYLQQVVNYSGDPDRRAVQGIGVDSLWFKDQQEGRDEKTNVPGGALILEIGAHLESAS